MTIGPLPRMRMLLRSVRLGIGFRCFGCVCCARSHARRPVPEGLGRRRTNALSFGARIYAVGDADETLALRRRERRIVGGPAACSIPATTFIPSPARVRSAHARD